MVKNMFMKIGNEEKAKCVRPTEILDVNCGLNVVDFETNSAYGTITLKAECGLNILCKSRTHDEYLEMIKLSREAVKEVI